MQKFWVVIGFVFLGLGIVGTLLPVMPTVPFLFCAYFAFKKGSPRFRYWYEHTRFHAQFVKSVNSFFALPMARKVLYILSMGLFFTVLFYMWYKLLPKLFEFVVGLL